MEVFSEKFKIDLFNQISELEIELQNLKLKAAKIKTLLVVGAKEDSVSKKEIIINAYLKNPEFNKSDLAKKLNVSRQYVYHIIGEIKQSLS